MDFCNLSRSNLLSIMILAVVTLWCHVEVKSCRQRPAFCRTLCCKGDPSLRVVLVEKDSEDRLVSLSQDENALQIQIQYKTSF